MISPIIERAETGDLVVKATELTVRGSPWGNVRHDVIDSAFVTVEAVDRGATIATMSRALSREELLAFSRQFALLAEAIPEQVAA